MQNRLLLGVAKDKAGISRGYWYAEGADSIYWSDSELESVKYSGELNASLYKYMTFYSEMNHSIDLGTLQFEYTTETGVNSHENLRIWIDVVKMPVSFNRCGIVNSPVYDLKNNVYMFSVVKNKIWTMFDCDLVVSLDAGLTAVVGMPIPANAFWYIIRKSVIKEYDKILSVFPSWYSHLFTDDEVIVGDMKVSIFNKITRWVI